MRWQALFLILGLIAPAAAGDEKTGPPSRASLTGTMPSPPPAAVPLTDKLARRYADKRQALLRDTAAKIKAVKDDASLSAQDKQRRLDALSAEAKAGEAKLDKDFGFSREKRREMERAKKSADETAARQKKLDELDEIRTQASQQGRP